MRSKCIIWLILGLSIAWVPYSLAKVPNAPPRHFSRKYTPKPTRETPRAKKKPFAITDPDVTAERDKDEKRRNLALERDVQRAWMYSAIVPGWGQAYNQQYGRVVAIYVMFGVFGWGAHYYHREYRQAKLEYIQASYDDYSMKSYVNYCRRYRDLFIIAGSVWYLANIVDACAGASLKTFDISNDLSLKVKPAVVPTACNAPAVGVSVSLSFKR